MNNPQTLREFTGDTISKIVLHQRERRISHAVLDMLDLQRAMVSRDIPMQIVSPRKLPLRDTADWVISADPSRISLSRPSTYDPTGVIRVVYSPGQHLQVVTDSEDGHSRLHTPQDVQANSVLAGMVYEAGSAASRARSNILPPGGIRRILRQL